MSEQIIAILNKDETACRLMRHFEEAAAEVGMLGEEYEAARKTVMMMAIANNQEAMSIMASEMHADVNA